MHSKLRRPLDEQADRRESGGGCFVTPQPFCFLLVIGHHRPRPLLCAVDRGLRGFGQMVQSVLSPLPFDEVSKPTLWF